MESQSKSGRLTRRSILQRGALVGAASLTGAIIPRNIYAQTRTLKRVTMVRPSAKSFLWGPEDYGMATGIFEKHGIQVEVLGSNRGVNITGVVSGDIDIGIGDPSETFNVRAQGQDIKIFGQMHNGYTVHILVKQSILDAAGVNENSPEEKRLQVLKSLRLGHPGVGSGPEMLIRYLANLGGLNPETEMKLISITGAGPGMIAGVQQGVIDGFSWGAPFANVGIKQYGLGYLVQMQRNPPALFTNMKTGALQSSAKSLVDKRELLLAYLAGYAQSQQAVQQDPEKYKKWLAAWLEIDPEVFEAAYKDNFSMYAQNPWPERDVFPKFFKFLNTANATRGMAPMAELRYEEFVDQSISDDAKKKI